MVTVARSAIVDLYRFQSKFSPFSLVPVKRVFYASFSCTIATTTRSSCYFCWCFNGDRSFRLTGNNQVAYAGRAHWLNQASGLSPHKSSNRTWVNHTYTHTRTVANPGYRWFNWYYLAQLLYLMSDPTCMRIETLSRLGKTLHGVRLHSKYWKHHAKSMVVKLNRFAHEYNSDVGICSRISSICLDYALNYQATCYHRLLW